MTLRVSLLQLTSLETHSRSERGN